MKGIWGWLICSAAVGMMGMIGVQKDKSACMLLSALMLPVLIFAELWFSVSMADISCSVGVIAFLVLLGYRGEKK